MQKHVLLGLFFHILVATGNCSDTLSGTVQFASIDKARELLTQEDAFTLSWSQFDIDSRMGKQNSTKEELLRFIADQAREWSLDEARKVQGILDNIDAQILQQEFRIDFPDEIYFVKTTADEEGGAGGYTRANYVVLKDALIGESTAMLEQIVLHELFHILSRANPSFREEMYKIIGFQMMDPVDYPEQLRTLRITNPDAPQTDCYIQLKVDNAVVDCMMILYAQREYSGGSFFQYLKTGFLRLSGGRNKHVDIRNGLPVIYDLKDVAGFYEQVGKNTLYIIHPEEILADNFVFAIQNTSGLPRQDIIEQIKAKLRA